MHELLRLENPLVRLSFDIATQAHEGVMYGSEPYISHPIEVAVLAKNLGYQPEVEAGCLLYDTVEDTDLTLGQLIKHGIPTAVVQGVEAVTFGDTKDIKSKIEKAKNNPLGHVIKFCDSSRNFASTVNQPESLGAEDALEYALDYANKLGELAIGLPSIQDIQLYLDRH